MSYQLTEEQINDLQDIVAERRDATLRMFHMTAFSSAYRDQDAFLARLNSEWHKCDSLVDHLECMRKINFFEYELPSPVSTIPACNTSTSTSTTSTPSSSSATPIYHHFDPLLGTFYRDASQPVKRRRPSQPSNRPAT